MIKRKRNKKLENEIRYDVVSDTMVDPALLEAYKVSNLNTGMEAEEEKEHHLRSIIAQGSGEIPTPVVDEQEEYVRYGEYKRPRDFIRWDGDAQNEIVVDAGDLKFLGEKKLDVGKFVGLVSGATGLEGVGPEVKDYVHRRVLKTISEDNQADAYICFRKRIPKPPRKSRRSESNVNERLRRMWVEFNILKGLYTLHLKRCELEREYLECNKSIASIGLELGPDDKLRNKIQRRLFKKKRGGTQTEYYKSCGPFKELVCNYGKVRMLKDFLHKADPKINTLDLEREAKAFENYKRRKFN